MLQNISNLLIFDIDEEQEIYNNNNMNISDTYFPQLNGDVIYSKKLRDLELMIIDKDQENYDNTNHRGVTTQDDIELPDIDLKKNRRREELELKSKKKDDKSSSKAPNTSNKLKKSYNSNKKVKGGNSSNKKVLAKILELLQKLV
ncbi:hypothetical protein GLOIN_2v1785982 [Rhizophagus irregularis DAOM 181602=DAOM 197198]|uniref:Uncharacterized protein n=1 Tax=Rhizophagus irregularis (strain DAOM 181602 / DAOM 197198 / MUCL 43194) TaxID=747089 RepID=A0A2P4P974_RHIID|nr:hypothetical protein GLOIN_2v1785982 [Rhizophagus irregularis DAOM 181602=DAOM 197198]POG61931.1 hypothetical protein GLOIN_2v1785982 [Rhizophagus irregularis DAOM 181602=DAOM 197198]|eukprot:XP_025168797.1 hypothetical protein GLOIN_2v1785982 [Rhizophagus irregularis DAOM 181602=DAOM 197198]